ncbi:hypothetical protein JCM11641_006501 [Rhodosporidiobolus odoratus]
MSVKSVNRQRRDSVLDYMPTGYAASDPGVSKSREFGHSAGTEVGHAGEHPGSITLEHIDDWHDELEKDPQYALAKTILSRTNMKIVLQSRHARIQDQMIFSHKISLEGEPITNQLSSGRCWLFSLCNVVRIFTSRKFGLRSFQLSQSYLFFYDHLSKANYFLEQALDTADQPLDSRTVQFLFSQIPAQDGGQWDFAVALVENYGLCPQTVFPESWNSSNSAALDALLTSKLREMALKLRKAILVENPTASRSGKRAAMQQARNLKDEMLKEIYRILTITCGTPPKPNEKIVWEYVDKNKRVQRLVTTPLEFAQKHAGYNCSDCVSVVDDPRHAYKTVLTVERSGNVVGAPPVRWFNLPSIELADLAISILKADMPVWFACDVEKATNTQDGIMDTHIRQYKQAFGTRVRMSKEERVLSYDSAPVHAMTLTGVHLDPETGEPVRWRVENSWGPEACNKGFLVMTHDWFKNYVFNIVAPRSFLSRDLLDIYDHSAPTSLPPWDFLRLIIHGPSTFLRLRRNKRWIGSTPSIFSTEPNELDLAIWTYAGQCEQPEQILIRRNQKACAASLPAFRIPGDPRAQPEEHGANLSGPTQGGGSASSASTLSASPSLLFRTLRGYFRAGWSPSPLLASLLFLPTTPPRRDSVFDTTEPAVAKPTGFVSGAGSEAGHAGEHPGSITLEHIDDWHDELEKDPQYALAKTVLSRTNMNIVLQSRQAKIQDQMIFSDQISLEGNPVANQLSSGRCWLFATCNVVRIFTSRKFGLDNFQLSQSYLFFYDHLSKANYFLEQALDTADQPLDSRTVQYLFSSTPAQDGGQWDLAVSLVENFGLCPQTVFPESWNSSNSAALDALLTSKLREMALKLRKAILAENPTASRSGKRAAMQQARNLKDEMLKEIYRILTITCGTPPKPDEKIVWEYVDKNKRVQRLVTTPLEFAQKHAGYNCSDTISVVNDPRHDYKATYTVDRLGNVVGGRPLRYLNMPSADLATLAISILKTDTPVWFGCDVDKCSNTQDGIMDMRLFEYDEAFGTVVRMSKKQRLLASDSSMTHAMMLTGVHIDPDTGKPVRWRVENSWGPEACNKGFLVMTHEWFKNYVFQIVAPRSYVPHDLLDVYDHATPTVLPPWDVFDGELDWAALDKLYGELEVDCVGCLEVQGHASSTRDEKEVHHFADLLQLWQAGQGRVEYLKDWHLPLAVHRAGEASGGSVQIGRDKVEKELYEVMDCWADDWMNEHEGGKDGKGDDFRFVYAGGGDTFTALHRDVYCSYSISTNLYGCKRWYLFPPDLTPALRPLILEAERQDRGVNCDAWSREQKSAFEGRGMLIVEQEQGETIFIPSGWYHSVHNLSHPTLSLNHNWANSHCLRAIYTSLCTEVSRAREAIDDVKDLIIEQAKRKGQGEAVWHEEWEKEVDALVERSEGWSFPIFFRMIRYTLSNLAASPSELSERMSSSRWPAVPAEARPPLSFVIEKVRSILIDFRQRQEQELRSLPGLGQVVEDIEAELARLEVIASAGGG